jgi:hypothetical protein
LGSGCSAFGDDYLSIKFEMESAVLAAFLLQGLHDDHGRISENGTACGRLDPMPVGGFAAYLSTLPTSEDMRSQIGLILSSSSCANGTKLAAMLDQEAVRLRQQFRFIAEAGELVSDEAIFEKYVHTRLLVRSRVWSLMQSSEKPRVTALVPLAEMLNMDSLGPVTKEDALMNVVMWPFRPLEMGSTALVMHTRRFLPSGAELFFSYESRLSNMDLLFAYGFFLHWMANRNCSLGLSCVAPNIFVSLEKCSRETSHAARRGFCGMDQ